MRQDKRYILNENIVVDEVHLVDENGVSIGIVATQEALAMAKAKGLDLLLLDGDTEPSETIIVNFPRYKFELNKAEREQRKVQHRLDVKHYRNNPKC